MRAVLRFGARRPGTDSNSRLWIGLVVLVASLGIVAEAGAGLIEVSWTAPVTNANGTPLTDLAGYRVYVGTSSPACPGSSFHPVSSGTTSPGANQTVRATITGLNAGTTYFVRVTAVDSSGSQSACTGAVSGVARGSLSVSPTGAVAFGSIALGALVDRTFTVQNTSGASVTGGASVSAPFSIVSGGSFTLAAGASQAVVVRFRPTSLGSFAGNVNFTAQGDTVARGVSGSTTGSPPSPPSGTPTLTITRSGSGSGTVTSSPSGISCGSDCTHTYTVGTRVTLTASAASGSTFAGWSGNGCSGTGTCAVTVNGSMGVTAGFNSAASTSLPDLIIRALSIPSTVSRTSAFPMSFDVVNQGSGAAGPTRLNIYLTRDIALRSGNVLIRVLTLNGIPAGGKISNAITQTFPSGTGTGTYYIFLVPDQRRVVAESNESNNTVKKAITIR
jgi:CARDB/Divergent InlB B-repeat domain